MLDSSECNILQTKVVKDFGRTYDVHYTSDKHRCFKDEDGVVKFDLKSCKMLIEFIIVK